MKQTRTSLSIIIEILVVFRLAISIMPAVGFYSSNILNIVSFLALYILLFMGMGPSRLLSGVFKYLPVFLISILAIIGLSIKGEPLIESLYVLTIDLLWPLVFLYVYIKNDVNMAKRLLVFIMVFYLITCITTFIGCYIYEGAPRHMSNGNFAENNPDLMALYTSFNIGSFSFVYSLVVLSPLVLFMLKNKIIGSVFNAIVVVILTAVIIKMEYTTALLLYLSCFALLLLPRDFTMKQFNRMTIALMLFLFVFAPLLPAILDFLSESLGSEQVSERLGSISDLWSYRTVEDDSDLGSRFDLWGQSLKIFADTFPLGSLDKAGGHSFIFDNMAKYGIFGLIAMIIVFKQFYSRFIKQYNGINAYGYVIYAYILNLIECFVNPGNNYLCFTFIIPLFCLYFKNVEKQKKTIMLE